MKLPDELLDHVDVKRWTVFKGLFPENGVNEKPHVCVVIKIHQFSAEDAILYFYMTSNDGALRHNKRDIASVVQFEPSDITDYFEKPLPTYIQCGKPYLYSIKLKDYKRKVTEGLVSQFDQLLSQENQSKICNAISRSKTYSKQIKEELLGE